MSQTTQSAYRFEVALSFAGDDKRAKVRSVAEALQHTLGPGKVFFDEWFEAELAGLDAQVVLQNIYRKLTRLVVTCVCQRYAEKPWTQDEWRAIQSFERSLRDAGTDNIRRMRFMPLRFGDGEVDGIFDTALVPDVRDRSPDEIAKLILERHRLTLRQPETAEQSPAGKPAPSPEAPEARGASDVVVQSRSRNTPAIGFALVASFLGALWYLNRPVTATANSPTNSGAGVEAEPPRSTDYTPLLTPSLPFPSPLPSPITSPTAVPRPVVLTPLEQLKAAVLAILRAHGATMSGFRQVEGSVYIGITCSGAGEIEHAYSAPGDRTQPSYSDALSTVKKDVEQQCAKH